MKKIKIMQKMLYGVLILTIAVLGLTAQSFAAAAANPEDVFTFEDGAWRVKSGGELKAFDGAAGTVEQDGEAVEWCYVDPRSRDEAKGMERGVLLYSESWENTPYTYLLLDEDAAMPLEVSFTPYPSFYVAVKSKAGQSALLLSLYNTEYDEGQYGSLKSFMVDGGAHGFFWTNVNDDIAIAFTMTDENGWRSAAVFYPPYGVERVGDGLIVLKKGTENEGYEVIGVSDDGGELTLAVHKGQQRSEVKVKVPPIPEEAIPSDGEE